MLCDLHVPNFEVIDGGRTITDVRSNFDRDG